MTSERISRRAMLSGTMGAAATALLARRAKAATKKRPNFVFILIDDQSWDAMGHRGRYPFLKTPNMDRLAREGMSFENAFVTTSLCSPSRASFLTGCHAHRHGVRTNERKDPHPSIPIFPQALQKAGYETAFVGKWHMAPSAAPRPGFDYWLSFKGQGKYIDPELNENGRDFTQKGYMTDVLTVYADRWLRQPHEKPFCMLLWHKAVHGPFTPAERHKEAFPDAQMPKPANFDDDFANKPEWIRRAKKYGTRREPWQKSMGKEVPAAIPPEQWKGGRKDQLDYMRALLAVDDSVGAMLRTLEETGRLDNTVVVFSSDNGFFLGEHRRGDKRLMYEESIRIPLLVRYPKAVKAGSTRPEMVLNIDVAPTLLELAGANTPATVQGTSFAPLLKGEKVPWRKSFLYAYYKEGWLPGIPTMLGVRGERWKYTHFPELNDDIDELYDLQSDPIEMKNLIADPLHKAQAVHMKGELDKLLRETAYGEEPAREPVEVPLKLALHYSFLKTDGTRVLDESGGGLHGILRGASVVPDRKRRKVLSLQGKGHVEVPTINPAFDPSMKPLSAGAWCNPGNADGVLLSFGGQSNGFSFYLREGLPHFVAISGGELSGVQGPKQVRPGAWVHLLGVLTGDRKLRLYVDGRMVAEVEAADFILTRPNEGCVVGADLGTPAGDYADAPPWSGLLSDVRLYWGEIDRRTLRQWVEK